MNKLIFEKRNQSEAKKAPSKLKGGYSLIELIVVVAIIAILVGLSAVGMSVVNARRATRAGKLIDSELTVFTSNSIARDGEWRLVFDYNDANKSCEMKQERKVGEGDWEQMTSQEFTGIQFDFGGKTDTGKYVIGVSRENGCYKTGEYESGKNYFADTITVSTSGKTVVVELSQGSGGHRIIEGA